MSRYFYEIANDIISFWNKKGELDFNLVKKEIYCKNIVANFYFNNKCACIINFFLFIDENDF